MNKTMRDRVYLENVPAGGVFSNRIDGIRYIKTNKKIDSYTVECTCLENGNHYPQELSKKVYYWLRPEPKPHGTALIYSTHRSTIQVKPGAELNIHLENNLYGIEGTYLVVEEHVHTPSPPSLEPKRREITAECEATLVKSQHSKGYYVKIKHKGKDIMVLGLDDRSAFLKQDSAKRVVPGNYSVEKADNTTVSFHIYRER